MAYAKQVFEKDTINVSQVLEKGSPFINKVKGVLWPGGDRGVYGGGSASSVFVNSLHYITISATGNSTDFGDLVATNYRPSAFSNGFSNRGVWAGGYTSSSSTTNVIQYITITSTGNATNSGYILTRKSGGSVGASNGTSNRGVVYGGLEVTGELTTYHNVIDYVTINSLSNATDFGDTFCNYSTNGGTVDNGTDERAVTKEMYWYTWTGAWPFPGWSFIDIGGESLEYITINSAGNSQDFGDLLSKRAYVGAVSNKTDERGVFAGGGYVIENLSDPEDPTYTFVNVIQYITINSTGNATDFGDYTFTTGGLAGASNGERERGVFMEGEGSSGNNYYITINSTGNALSFGNGRGVEYFIGSGLSNS